MADMYNAKGDKDALEQWKKLLGLSDDDAAPGVGDLRRADDASVPPERTTFQKGVDAVGEHLRTNFVEPMGQKFHDDFAKSTANDQFNASKWADLAQGDTTHLMDDKPQVPDGAHVADLRKSDDDLMSRVEAVGDSKDEKPKPPETAPRGGGVSMPRVSAQRIDTYQPGAAYDPTTQLQTVMGKFSNAMAKQGAADDPEFPVELSKINQLYTDAKGDLEKREMFHAIAEGLTKIGAGLYGQKTGTDMSHLQMGTHDFSKDMANLQEELKVRLADLRGRREEAAAKDQHAAENEMRQKQFALDTIKTGAEIHHQGEMENQGAYEKNIQAQNAQTQALSAASTDAYHRGLLSLYSLKSTQGTDPQIANQDINTFLGRRDKEAQRYQAGVKAFTTELDSIVNPKNAEYKKASTDEQLKNIKESMKRNIGLSDEAADVIVKDGAAKNGWIFKDVDQGFVKQQVNKIAAAELRMKEARAQGMVTVLNKATGQTGNMGYKKALDDPNFEILDPDFPRARPGRAPTGGMPRK